MIQNFIGFKTSKNYKKLWKLIKQGHRIPAWVLYNSEYRPNIYDIVEVKYRRNGYRIGTRGISYESWGDEENEIEFYKLCKKYKLFYISPI